MSLSANDYLGDFEDVDAEFFLGREIEWQFRRYRFNAGSICNQLLQRRILTVVNPNNLGRPFHPNYNYFIEHNEARRTWMWDLTHP
uniref:Polyphosphate kinase n=1 Tax=Heterorhabditis bacteriophora TaxID=37862 RepID=A0A1I7WLE3_HETBA